MPQSKNDLASQVRFSCTHILLAEDDHFNQKIDSNMLEGFGCRVTIVETGTQVLRSVTTYDSFDLILMDNEMPEMNGYDAARILAGMKRAGACRDIPILALSANDDKESRTRSLACGMSDFLTKPLRKEILAQKLIAWLPHGHVVKTGRNTERETPGETHVLLAEDNLVNRKLAAEVLKQLNFRITTVGNGRAAVAALSENPDIDIILMDCMMPEMDGFEATRQIRALQKTGGIQMLPIIALTALAMKGDRERCFAAGMSDYLSKPVHKGELKAMVLKWTGKHERADSDDSSVSTDVEPEIISDTNFTTDCLDLRELNEVRMALGSKFSSVLELYLKDTRTRLNAIENTMSAGQGIRPVIREAHSVCSSSAHMGAIQLAELARSMETMARDNAAGTNMGNFNLLLDRMKQAFGDAEKAFAPYIGKNAGTQNL